MRFSCGSSYIDEPAVERVAERDLDLGLGMHAQEQHRRREHHHVVDAHAVHGAPGQHDLAMRAFGDDGLGLVLLMR